MTTILFIAFLSLAFSPLTVLAQGTLGSVLKGLKDANQFYHLYKDMITATLKYHFLKDELRTSDIIRGDIISRRTLLDDPRYTNVTGGQQVLLTKQPDDAVVVTSGFWTRGTITRGRHENIRFDNGVIQLIDAVMRVPLPLAATARDSYTDMTAFVGALYKLGIYDAFNNMTDVTLFVPYNKAFQQLAGRFESMEKPALRRVLKYHAIRASQLVHGWDLKNGSTLSTTASTPDKKDVPINSTITRDGNIIYINSAQVVVTDMLISNGLVHVIDNVLDPAHESARPDLGMGTQTPVFSPTGATSVGPKAPTPFVENLPCTRDCPEPSEAPAASSSQTFRAAAVPTPTSNAAVAPLVTGYGHGLGWAALGALVVL
ncbi:FAS1 domain containing protein [Rhypophila decipiens]